MEETTEPKKVYINVVSRRSPEWGAIIKLHQAIQFAAKNGISCSLVPRVGESLM